MSDVRLIDANALLVEVAHRNALDVIPGADFERIWLYSTVQLDMFQIIKAAPSIDALSVVHAYWMDDTYCSNCRAAKARLWAGYLEQNANTFCHVCGAKMDAKDIDVPTKDGGAENGC